MPGFRFNMWAGNPFGFNVWRYLPLNQKAYFGFPSVSALLNLIPESGR